MTQSENEAMMDDDAVAEAVLRYLDENSATVVADAAPARDLWPAIEGRIGARVLPIAGRRARNHPAWLRMAAAAMLLVIATSGLTYVVTRSSMRDAERARTASVPAGAAAGTQSAPSVDVAANAAATPATGMSSGTLSRTPSADAGESPRTSATQLVLHVTPRTSSGDAARTTYDQEIMALHSALEARRGQLDPSTVATIEQNLQVVDNAIAQAKAALAKDPHSRLLNDQLDRTLAKKTDLLRAAALLPSA